MRLCATKHAVVEAVFPTMSEAREKICWLVSDLSLEVNLVRGRLAPYETRLNLELRGEEANLAQGVRGLGLAGPPEPAWARAS